jgi:hypothetical protein
VVDCFVCGAGQFLSDSGGDRVLLFLVDTPSGTVARKLWVDKGVYDEAQALDPIGFDTSLGLGSYPCVPRMDPSAGG